MVLRKHSLLAVEGQLFPRARCPLEHEPLPGSRQDFFQLKDSERKGQDVLQTSVEITFSISSHGGSYPKVSVLSAVNNLKGV